MLEGAKDCQCVCNPCVIECWALYRTDKMCKCKALKKSGLLKSKVATVLADSCLDSFSHISRFLAGKAVNTTTGKM